MIQGGGKYIMSTLQTIKNFAVEDIGEIIRGARKKFKLPPSHLLKIEYDYPDDVETSVCSVYCTAIIDFYEGDETICTVEFTWSYKIGSDGEVYMTEMPELIERLYDEFYMESGEYVASSTRKIGRAILAAEDEDDVFIDNTDGDGLSDQLDDISDRVEDIQDQVDEIDEDTVDIETDNNIENHYIAECDKCHGIFISAVLESDQEVEKVSGICPLCESESDQYLKWVVKAK